MKRAIAAVVLSAVTIAGHLVAQRTDQEQTSFCPDSPSDDLRKPTPLPTVVVTALMETKEGREARRLARNEGKRLNPSHLFRGMKVRLSDSPDVFFLVIGDSPMSGADNTWFWVVRQSDRGASILLWAGANCLNIKKSSTHGFRDIETEWSSASQTIAETYVYDGKAYRLQQRKSQPARW